MKYGNYFLGALLCGALAAPAVVRADSSADEIIRKSSQTLQEMKSSKVVPSATLARAKCVAIFPNVTDVALVVGGAHGHGVITCKNSDAKWSRVGFVDLTLGSIGAQVGAKRSDIVMAFLTDKAKEAVTKGTFTFGGDLSGTLGSKDFNVNADTAGPDVVAFTSDSGIFVGATLNGTHVSSDEKGMKSFYREDLTLSRAMGDFTASPTPAEEGLITSITAGSAATSG